MNNNKSAENRPDAKESDSANTSLSGSLDSIHYANQSRNSPNTSLSSRQSTNTYQRSGYSENISAQSLPSAANTCPLGRMYANSNLPDQLSTNTIPLTRLRAATGSNTTQSKPETSSNELTSIPRQQYSKSTIDRSETALGPIEKKTKKQTKPEYNSKLNTIVEEPEKQTKNQYDEDCASRKVSFKILIFIIFSIFLRLL